MNKSKIARQITKKSRVPQSQPLDRHMIRNDAGGYVYQVDSWTHLMRFLILGTYGGTYYVSEKAVTQESILMLEACLIADPQRYVDCVVEVSQQGRAAKNDFAIFALAFACAHSTEARQVALPHLQSVCRIATHLFQFLEDYKALGGGFGRSVKRAVANWYNSKTPDDLAFQMLKYRNRNNWTHRDVLRVSHPSPQDKWHGALYQYATCKNITDEALPALVSIFEELRSGDIEKARRIVRDNPSVVWEMVPTEWLNDPHILASLASRMPAQALVRNLSRMHSAFDWDTENTYTAVREMVAEFLFKLKLKTVHPLFLLTAWMEYTERVGSQRGSIANGLSEAFRNSLKTVEPTGLRILQGIDVSGSMGAQMANKTLNCEKAALGMAWAMALIEPNSTEVTFDTRIVRSDCALSSQNTLEEAFEATGISVGGGTDLTQPVQWALKNGKEYDLIVIYTDNETWAGEYHLPSVWEEYRATVNSGARLVIASTSNNCYTVGDPKHPSVLQTVGFDSNLPMVIQEWVKF